MFLNVESSNKTFNDTSVSNLKAFYFINGRYKTNFYFLITGLDPKVDITLEQGSQKVSMSGMTRSVLDRSNPKFPESSKPQRLICNFEI